MISEGKATAEAIISKDRMPPVRVTASAEELISRALDQNFVPVVDDRDMFMGIVTRRAIISYCLDQGLIDEDQAPLPNLSAYDHHSLSG